MAADSHAASPSLPNVPTQSRGHDCHVRPAPGGVPFGGHGGVCVSARNEDQDAQADPGCRGYHRGAATRNACQVSADCGGGRTSEAVATAAIRVGDLTAWASWWRIRMFESTFGPGSSVSAVWAAMGAPLNDLIAGVSVGDTAPVGVLAGNTKAVKPRPVESSRPTLVGPASTSPGLRNSHPASSCLHSRNSWSCRTDTCGVKWAASS